MDRINLLALLVLLPSCAPGDQDGSRRLTLAEDAGTPVLESARPVWSLSIPEVSPTVISSWGEPGGVQALGDIREAVILSSGGVVFLDFQTGELTLARQDGSMRTLARRGQGPGELQRPGNLGLLPGDSIQVYDRLQRRVSVFLPTGELAYSLPLGAPGSVPPTRAWRYQDTLFAGVRPVRGERPILAATPEASLGVIPMEVLLFDREGEEVATLLSLPGLQVIQIAGSSLAPAFGLEVPFAVSRTGDLFLGDGSDPEFLTVSNSGDTVQITRLDLPAHPVDRDSLARLLAGDGGLESRVGGAVEDLPMLAPAFLPERQPAYKDIRGLRDGRVMLGSADPFLLPSSEWYLTSLACGWEGTLTLPPRTRLLDLDLESGLILLSRMDELDVQTLELRVLHVPDVGGDECRVG